MERDVQDERSKHPDDEALVRGTNEASPNDGSAEASKHDPAAEAVLIANEMRKGLEHLIRGAERIASDLDSYSDNDARAFVKQLARQGVIPEEEGKLVA
jgi:hypothetical protein